jgi:hypothetical protein
MATYFVISLCDILCELPEPHGAREDVWVGNLSTASGDVWVGNLSTASGDHLSGNRSKA